MGDRFGWRQGWFHLHCTQLKLINFQLTTNAILDNDSHSMSSTPKMPFACKLSEVHLGILTSQWTNLCNGSQWISPPTHPPQPLQKYTSSSLILLCFQSCPWPCPRVEVCFVPNYIHHLFLPSLINTSSYKHAYAKVNVVVGIPSPPT
jgi:hypothetical protein